VCSLFSYETKKQVGDNLVKLSTNQNKDKTVKTRKIANLLRKALLQEGKMKRALYEYELGEHT
jgi:hypothetical protein